MAHNLEGEFCVKAMILLPVEMLCYKVLQFGQLWKGIQIACPDTNNLSWISGSINTYICLDKNGELDLQFLFSLSVFNI
jgi:hypothetical protein